MSGLHPFRGDLSVVLFRFFSNYYLAHLFYNLAVSLLFGISLVFMPFLYFFPVPESAYYWFLLIFQGLLIGIYDSHLFFASADFGASSTRARM